MRKSTEEMFKEIDTGIENALNLYKRGDFEKCLKAYKTLYKKAITHNHIQAQGRINQHLALIYNYRSENTIAMEYCSQAITLAESTKDLQRCISAYNTMGSIYLDIGDNPKALEYYIKALDFAEQVGDDKTIMGINININSVYTRLHYTDKALKHNKKILKYCKEKNLVEGVIMCLAHIAGIYFQGNDYQKAEKYYKQSINYSKKNNLLVDTLMLSNLANVYIDRKKYKQAKSLLKQVIYQKDDTNEPRVKAFSFISLAQVYMIENDYTKAKNCLDEAEKTIDLNQDGHAMKRWLDTYIELYAHIGDFENAFKFQQKHTDLLVKTFNEDTVEKIANLRAEFEISKKEKEAEIYRLKNVELAQTNEDLKILHSSKDTIIRIISHDLKNILGVTSLTLELIRSQPMNDKLANYINKISTNTDRAIQIVKDILQSSEIETPHYTLDLQPHKIDEYFKSITPEFSSACELKKIEFITEFSAKNAKAKINPDKMWQLLNNLIHNAIKFTPREGKVYLKTEVGSSKTIRIKIKDTGVGIPSEYLPILFEKFTKAKRKGTEGESTTGIGLSIVKRLVELHNGTITVTSELDKGTEFSISLPCL